MNTEKFIDEKIKSGFLSERYNEDGTTSVIGEHSYWCEIIDELFKQSQETRPHETFVNRVMNVVICNDCKSYWIGKVQKCKCGCKTLTKTHKSNARYAINLE